MKTIYLTLLIFVSCLSVTGCMKFKALIDYDHDLQRDTRQATEALFANTRQSVNRQQTILVASLVNIDNLTESSTFGRTLSQYISSWIVQNDFSTTEMKLSSSVFFKQREGTFFLSRDIKKLTQKYEAQAIVVGTYSIADSTCTISLRLINALDAKILSAIDYQVSLGSNTKKMLGYRKD